VEHLQSCPLLVLFMQIHDLASVGHFGQKLSSRKHFAQSLKHFSSLLCLQSHFFGSVTQLVSSHMGGMNISLLFSPPAIASSTSLLLLLRTLGWPNHPWLPGLLPDLSLMPGLMPVNQEPIVIVVATPSLSLDALVLFPQPPIQAELFGSSPVLSFTWNKSKIKKSLQ